MLNLSFGSTVAVRKWARYLSTGRHLPQKEVRCQQQSFFFFPRDLIAPLAVGLAASGAI